MNSYSSCSRVSACVRYVIYGFVNVLEWCMRVAVRCLPVVVFYCSDIVVRFTWRCLFVWL